MPDIDPYRLVLLVAGIALLGAAWLPHLLKRRALSFPIVYVILGALLYSFDLPLPDPRPLNNGEAIERLCEITVLVALLGAGIRIDTRFSWRGWGLTWRLLGFGMPLTILGGWLIGQQWLGYSLAGAVLLGAVLAPTDPVLASDLQVGAPHEGGEDPVRFSLTSEAGLNDASPSPSSGWRWPWPLPRASRAWTGATGSASTWPGGSAVASPSAGSSAMR